MVKLTYSWFPVYVNSRKRYQIVVQLIKMYQIMVTTGNENIPEYGTGN
jgi:hypothetical protein